jgi:hypothetical protein
VTVTIPLFLFFKKVKLKILSRVETESLIYWMQQNILFKKTEDLSCKRTIIYFQLSNTCTAAMQIQYFCSVFKQHAFFTDKYHYPTSIYKLLYHTEGSITFFTYINSIQMKLLDISMLKIDEI